MESLPEGWHRPGTGSAVHVRRQGGRGLRSGSIKSDCDNVRKLPENCGKSQENCGTLTKPPEASRRNTYASGTHRALTGTRGGEKTNCGKIAGKCGKLREIAKLRKTADPNPPPWQLKGRTLIPHCSELEESIGDKRVGNFQKPPTGHRLAINWRRLAIQHRRLAVDAFAVLCGRSAAPMHVQPPPSPGRTRASPASPSWMKASATAKAASDMATPGRIVLQPRHPHF